MYKRQDVFCEPGWFTPEESEDILLAARDGGLTQRMHIDEFADGGGGELAAELKVVTADHAHYTSDETRMKMEASGVNTGFCREHRTRWVQRGLHLIKPFEMSTVGRLLQISIQIATF